MLVLVHNRVGCLPDRVQHRCDVQLLPHGQPLPQRQYRRDSEADNCCSGSNKSANDWAASLHQQSKHGQHDPVLSCPRHGQSLRTLGSRHSTRRASWPSAGEFHLIEK